MIVNSSQDIKKCTARGRDCIEAKSDATFNCQTPCQGIYADINQWYSKYTVGNMEDMIEPLLKEYKTFKKNNVKHFRYDDTATSSVFGM